MHRADVLMCKFTVRHAARYALHAGNFNDLAVWKRGARAPSRCMEGHGGSTPPRARFNFL
jgi:hypothetical protein